jgi:hypothetical protein
VFDQGKKWQRGMFTAPRLTQGMGIRSGEVQEWQQQGKEEEREKKGRRKHMNRR